jgi:hypothetical protein
MTDEGGPALPAEEAVPEDLSETAPGGVARRRTPVRDPG